MVKKRIIKGSGLTSETQYLGGNCWGLVEKGKFVPDADESEMGVLVWKNENGAFRFAYVFGQDGVEIELTGTEE